MSVLKTDLTLFENLSDWGYKENFTTVTSEFGELDIHFVDENSNTKVNLIAVIFFSMKNYEHSNKSDCSKSFWMKNF